MTASAFDAYFASLAEGVVRIQVCAACGFESPTPRGFCPECGGDAWSVRELDSPTGTVHTFTEITVTGLENVETPLVVAMVDLDGGARLLARVRGAVAVGDRVEFADAVEAKDAVVPVFERADDE